MIGPTPPGAAAEADGADNHRTTQPLANNATANSLTFALSTVASLWLLVLRNPLPTMTLVILSCLLEGWLSPVFSFWIWTLPRPK